MNFKHYNQELSDRIPIIDVGMAVSLLGDLYGFDSPTYLPYGVQRDYEARGYTIPKAEVQGEIGTYQIELVDEEEADRMSVFGTPILGSFTIKGSYYNRFKPVSGIVEKREYPEFEFPVATIVDFERSKNITVTPIIGGDGSVKEIFNNGDWRINIRGVCLNDASRSAQKTAKEQQKMLIELYEIADSLVISKGNIFFNKSISELVIERLSFPAIQGKPGIIPYEIEAISDTPFLLMGEGW